MQGDKGGSFEMGSGRRMITSRVKLFFRKLKNNRTSHQLIDVVLQIRRREEQLRSNKMSKEKKIV